MKKQVILISALASLSFFAGNAAQAENVHIVGSSTVYPFASYVAEELGATTRFKTPIIESTGSGGGMKLFCAGHDSNTPDITNASRRMKPSEFKLCAKNGVRNITEVVIGFDGIAIAQSKTNKPINLTRKHILLAVAAEVPNKAGTKLIPNPYKYWNEIDASLPHRPIIFYGPPTSSGTRDAFHDLVMKALTKKMDIYTKLYKADPVKNKKYKKYKTIRTDGIYVPSGENDNLIVQKLTKDKNAFGIFGYSFLEENSGRVSAATVEGVAPEPKAISSGKYPISRSLFFYIKNDHLKRVKGMQEYINMFVDEDMIGEDGNLTEIGLIALPESQRDEVRHNVKAHKKLTAKDLKH
ncbi:MAG TPA: PstS family phosphate ABC transporter substrate-binding protein [Ghiorsea sp.]|nr:PstS family phosphate ABC transporter substrate-binding protein [Ghiorsea sp.]HIP07756.1 PstS family phosphate ABC transporter substrate-binding protein [Mariprofundaceae bacterium]